MDSGAGLAVRVQALAATQVPVVTTAAVRVPALDVRVHAQEEEGRTPTSLDVGNYEESKVAVQRL